ncbi:ABC transporter permease [Streptomyces sp. NBC_01498]|uniref:ABC transporter permease n=1 Tax=Streptomyces sp. NBC_01498 TaxID=2975870 RepID=UPI002E7C436B|nr:ABC transporter permease [Streptomyces sp. NBC_01498]WTL26017.1 ABC transporter permease [Streptomyces sp. NBC_01498]
MSTAVARKHGTTGTATGTTTRAGRLGALGRAELTLFVRNRTMLFMALLMPVGMILSTRVSLQNVDLGGTGFSIAEVALTGGVGMVLLLVVYMNLTSAYTARREELVLKRLRTGEVSDPEILAGTALPAASLALAQCVLLVAAGVVFLDVSAPQRPELLVLGVLAGTGLMTVLAAASAGFTRTVESAQITTLPMLLVSAMGSGLFIPLEALPDKVASVCELLPMTGIVTLVRTGWLGDAVTGDLVSAGLNALAWTVLAVFAVRKWFRWEPRR